MTLCIVDMLVFNQVENINMISSIDQEALFIFLLGQSFFFWRSMEEVECFPQNLSTIIQQLIKFLIKSFKLSGFFIIINL